MNIYIHTYIYIYIHMHIWIYITQFLATGTPYIQVQHQAKLPTCNMLVSSLQDIL